MARARRSTARPMRPYPTTPSVAPADRSRPESIRGLQIQGAPVRRKRSPSAIRRAADSTSPRVRSAVEHLPLLAGLRLVTAPAGPVPGLHDVPADGGWLLARVGWVLGTAGLRPARPA